MAKKKPADIATEFPTKEFSLLVPFTKVDMGGGMPMGGMGMMSEEDETMTIEGFANWFGEDVDESGMGVACDLAGDAVVPTGIDLSVYKGNPQILWQHDRCCSIGKANKAVRKKQGLFVNATIHKSAMEEEDWYRVKAGLVTRFSIGFRTLAGEYREIDGKMVFFITKSLLLEISIVTIPCSSESGFSIVKALDDGSFTGSVNEPRFHKEPQPNPTEEEPDVTKQEQEDDTVMKLPLKDLLSEEEVAHFKALGLEKDLEVEKEVPLKSYIDTAISKGLSAFKDELIQEIKQSVLPPQEKTETEEETKTEEETETEVKTEEEAEPEGEEKSEGAEETDFDTTEFKDAIASLKAAVEAVTK